MKIRYVFPNFKGTEGIATHFWVECSVDDVPSILGQFDHSKETRISYEGDAGLIPNFMFQPPNFYPRGKEHGLGFMLTTHWDSIAHYPDFFADDFRKQGLGDVWEIPPVQFENIDWFPHVVSEIIENRPFLGDDVNDAPIPNRVNLRRLKGIGLEKFVRRLPKEISQIRFADDDSLAMAYFLRALPKETENPMEFMGDESLRFTGLVGEELIWRGTRSARNGHNMLEGKSLFFSADEVGLFEIHSRRMRAEKTIKELDENLPDDFEHAHLTFARRLHGLSDDVLCEAFLFTWYCQSMHPFIKEFITVAEQRIRGNYSEPEWLMQRLSDIEYLHSPIEHPMPIPRFGVNPIDGNPFLGPQWQPLAKVIAFILEDARKHHSCELTTYGKNFGMNPYTSPYMQALWEDEDVLHVELSGNSICEPPLNGRQLAELEFIGWNSPDEDIPNFYRVWENPELNEVAEFVLTSLTSIYGIEETDHFAFGLERLPDLIEQMNLLERLPKTPGNEWGAIFRLKERHLKG